MSSLFEHPRTSGDAATAAAVVAGDGVASPELVHEDQVNAT